MLVYASTQHWVIQINFFHSIGKYKTFLAAKNSSPMQADFPKELEEVGTVMASSKILGKPYSKEVTTNEVRSFLDLLVIPLREGIFLNKAIIYHNSIYISAL